MFEIFPLRIAEIYKKYIALETIQSNLVIVNCFCFENNISRGQIHENIHIWVIFKILFQNMFLVRPKDGFQLILIQ